MTVIRQEKVNCFTNIILDDMEILSEKYVITIL